MTLGDGLMNMSLDDVADKPTRPPTLGEVKKSLRVCKKKTYWRNLTYFYMLVARQKFDSRGTSNG